uniref:Protein HGH1 homolog n=1 Tax=Graphocephala atropunctata TaxID=36148 RepID=A0A1B6LSV6_9HEMI
MEHTFKEIGSLLKDGPVRGKEKVFLEIFNIILSCTRQAEANEYFSSEFISLILKFMGENEYKNIIYRILINIFSEDELNETLSASKVIVDIFDLSISDINKDSIHADSASMLLSNITRCQNSCKRILDCESPLSQTLHKLVSAFTILGYNSTCSLDQLAMVLCNFSQLTEVRNIMTQPDHCMLQKLVPFMNHESNVRRRGITGVVHNCAFDSSVHEWLLGVDVDILPRLLLPLAGPEQFDDEDNDKLPIELQYLPDTKTREPDTEIRKQNLETLNQLCATRFGRQYLRDHNTYIILRELHKWEKDASTLLACENVVDILIRTEDEIGIDHLKAVDIPSDLEKKFENLNAN